jgi:hypothetical protein
MSTRGETLGAPLPDVIDSQRPKVILKMLSFSQVLDLLSLKFGSPVDISALEAQATLAGLEIPNQLRELYARGDGAELPSIRGEVVTIETAKRIVQYKPLEHTIYYPWPFFVKDGYASDPVGVIVRGPGKGFVMQSCHDGGDRMIAPSMEAFFNWLADSSSVEEFFDEEGPSPLFSGDLDSSTMEVVQEMMASAPKATDPYEGESLYDLVGSMVDDQTYMQLFTRERIPIRNYFACILSRARRMAPELRAPLEAMYPL